MLKFDRQYQMALQTNISTPASGAFNSAQNIIVEPPFTMEFDITKVTISSVRMAKFRLYNLSRLNQSLIRHDYFSFGTNPNALQRVTLRAGYQINMPVIFDGNIQEAWSYREKNNMITEITAGEGLLAFTGPTQNLPYPAGTPFRSVILQQMGTLAPYGISIGAVGAYPGVLPRANSYSGNTANILSELTGRGFFISNGSAYALADSECLTGTIPLINSESGLLGTPMREQRVLNFDMIFEPRIQCGQIIQLESSTAANFNGSYKVISVRHRGTISETVCGEAITTVGLAYGTAGFTVVK